MNRLAILLLVLALPLPARAALLVGYQYTLTGPDPCAYNPSFGCASEAPGYTWKTFRAKAVRNGLIHHFKLYVVSAPSAVAEIGWAIYEDSGGRVGARKAGGHVHRALSPGVNLLPMTFTRGTPVVAGRQYWITFHSSLGDQVTIQRGRFALCADSLRKFTNGAGSSAWTRFTPPPASAFINTMANGCYAWAVVTR